MKKYACYSVPLTYKRMLGYEKFTDFPEGWAFTLLLFLKSKLLFLVSSEQVAPCHSFFKEQGSESLLVALFLKSEGASGSLSLILK